MKTFRWVILSLAAISVLSILGVTMKQNKEARETRAQIEDLWKKVDRAQKDGLPQTAAGHLKDITALALKIDEKGQALKALVGRLAMESVVQGNKPAERIVRLKEEMSLMPADLQPVMKLILARWYWHYFQRNRWRFMQRSETAGLDEKDFTTWDLPRLYREIDSLYADVLKAEAYLKSKRLSELADFLRAGNQPSDLRPTLFDFASWEALEFYASAEQAAARPEDAFEVAADSGVLGPLAEFLAFRPETTDAESPKLNALRTFQALLEFHRADPRPDALLDADLARLRWARRTAMGEGASALYIRRLQELAEAYPRSALFSLACFHWAEELQAQGDAAAAFEVAGRGEKAFPDSTGGGDCRSLRAAIQAREYDLKAESVVIPGRPSSILVSYRNISSLHLRLVRQDFQALLKGGGEEPGYSGLSEAALKKLLARTPEKEWSVELKPTPDFKPAEALVEIPGLEPGHYFLLASLNKEFSTEANKIEAAAFWSSGLAVIFISPGRDGISGYVLRSEGGEPLTGADVVLYEWAYDRRAYEEVGRATSGELGQFFLIRAERYANRLVVVSDRSGNALAASDFPYGYRERASSGERTVFFTDRSIYRPGQMIHFKGICLSLNEGEADYRVLPGRKVKVSLLDVNDEEASVQHLVTNDFGSFSGVFTAPADRLTGEMTIACEDPDGRASVSVEEYKRPKFQVRVDVPEKEFRLNDEVEIGGEAAAYTGAAVDDALVRFRVVREVNLPAWWWAWFGHGRWGESQEIAHGTTRTDAEGKFTLRFPARPDASVPFDSRPVFTYTVSVDVTDGSGETRSAEGRVRVGAVSLEAALEVTEWLDSSLPVEIKVSVADLNGRPAEAEGAVEVSSLRGPEKPVPADLFGETAVREAEARSRGGTGFSGTSEWHKWPEAGPAARKEFRTAASTDRPSVLSFELKPGAYRARLTTRDKNGAAVEAVAHFVVLAPPEKTFGVPIPFHTAARSRRVEAGETFELLWATGHERGPLLVEVLRDNRYLQRFWTPSGQTQGMLRFPVGPELKGGFTVVVSAVKENRYYRSETFVTVPWTDRELTLRWTTFRSKLLPGQKERWALKILGPDALPAAAEMVAALYDASLDQFQAHDFPGLGGVFQRNWTSYASTFVNRELSFASFGRGLNVIPRTAAATYPSFPEEVWRNLFGFEYDETGFGRKAMALPASPPADAGALAEEMAVTDAAMETGPEAPEKKTSGPGPDLSQVQARRNLNETAFFFPHLLAGRDGTVSLEFTMPEALTEWRFLGLAHTRNLASGSLESRAVTQKDLMVQPNPPRFLREGDSLEFTVKVTNMSAGEVRGTVELKFSDPVSETPRDAELGNRATKKDFVIPAKQSRSFSWPVNVPDGLTVAAYRAVAATDAFSDGEEGWLPVLSRRIFLQESMPLWISGRGRKSFSLAKLAGSSDSKTLAHHGLTVQMASNPAWYAVQALPYLMEFPYECSEQVFNRLYANSLARHIALSDPKIRRVFDLWKADGALVSNLEKNSELKSVLLQETPWVLEAGTESQAKQRVGLLFDDNRLESEVKSAYGKLEDMMIDGSWPWFPGGRPNRYISLYIVTGFGRLKNMGVDGVPRDLALASLDDLDRWALESYQELVRRKALNENNLDSTAALYLYGRSFYLKEKPVPEPAMKAVSYFLEQAKAHWLKLGYRQNQGHLALALNRFGFPAEARKIMRSLKERSLTDEEMGRYWAEQEFSWWWYLAPIETQALMIEAFDEVMNDGAAVEECKIWLLKQKQTRDWKTTKATADAVYGLLLRGRNLLASEALVDVRLGRDQVEPQKVKAGTGYFEKRFAGAEVRPSMAEVTLVKTDEGIAWGGLHWQYFEDIGAVTPHVQNPLRLKKSLFVRRQTKRGPVIEPVRGPLEVGDTLVARIELRSDRDMEYVHMRDHRGSGLEPVNVLSRYKYQDGLWYYESTRDTATHFFIDFLPKGTYVFEYPLKVVHRGAYQSGLAMIECMYAPEFNSHSESIALEVR